MNENNNIDNRVDLNKNSEADIQRETVERVYSQTQQNGNPNIDLNKSNIDLNKQSQQQQQGNYTSFGNQPFGNGYNPNNLNQNMSGMYGGPVGYNNGNYTNNFGSPAQGGPKFNFPNFTMFIVFSILEFFCCSWIPGVIAFVFTMLANQKYQQNDMAGFESNYKVAKITLWIGLALAVAITIFYILYFILIIAVS